MSTPAHVFDAEIEREAERRWIAWVKVNYATDHVGAALAQLDRIATALEKLAGSAPSKEE